MPFTERNFFKLLSISLAALTLLSACGSPYQAPVGELGGEQRFLDAGRTHRVNSGETLYVVAWLYDLDFTALARVNGLREPYTITPGQVLEINLRETANSNAYNGAAIAQGATRVKVNPVQNTGLTQRSTLPSAPLQRSPLPETSNAEENVPQTQSAPRTLPTPVVRAPLPEPRIVEPTVTPIAQPVSTASPDEIVWQWPGVGAIIGRFTQSGVENKGVDLAGNKGDAVNAAADGVVVYAGSGVLRYGDLIIVKHTDRVLSAYAHNDRVLIAEGDSVRAGEKIAELGSSGIDRNMLHFEIRLDGKPVDPLLYLPAR